MMLFGVIKKVATAGAVLFLSTNAGSSAAAELRISGAATVAGGIINPNKAAIEQETGLTLNLTVNGDGNGLKDLYAGKVDVAWWRHRSRSPKRL